MSFSFSAHSTAQRATLHRHLQEVLDRLLEKHDFRIEEGARSAQRQQDLFDQKATQQRGFVNGVAQVFDHMIREDGTGWAADIYPFINGRMINVRGVGIDPSDSAKFARFLGILEGLAFDYFRGVQAMTNEKWGLTLWYNWDRDEEILTDQKFHDWPHVKLVRLG